MTMWIRRNGRALLIGVLMIALIGITITRPAWRDNIGYLRPKQTVPYGHSVVLGGVRWELTAIKPPDEHELQRYAFIPDELETLPPDTRLATYVVTRVKDGKPAAVPAGYTGCWIVANAGQRQWTKKAGSMSVEYWAQHHGYVTLCSYKFPGPMLVALIVPTGVQISSIDLQFLPNSWNDVTRPSKSTDLLVIGFDAR
jgi:hypothetical protein